MTLSIKDCNWPWFEAFVHVNGDVKPCCYATGNLGNLRDYSLRQIWHGDGMEEVRAYVSEDRLHPICVGASCVYVKDRIETAGDAGESYEVRLKRMVDSGSVWAAESFGIYLLNEKRELEAIPYFKKAAARGHSGAQFSLGMFLLEGLHGLSVDVPQGIALLEASAKQKDTRAIFALGQLYCDGRHVTQDIPKGSAMLKLAGERGESAAWLQLAELHKADPATALRYLKIAAQRGNRVAIQALQQSKANSGSPANVD